MRKIKKYFIIILLSIFTLTTVETSSLNFSAYIVQAKVSSSTKRKAQEAYRKFLTQRRYRYFTLWDIDKDGLKELLVTDGRERVGNSPIKAYAYTYTRGKLRYAGEIGSPMSGISYNCITKRLHASSGVYVAPFMNNEGKWGYINTDGDVVIECKYDSAYEFDQDGYAVVGMQTDSDASEYYTIYGLVNTEGEEIIPLDYSYINSSIGSTCDNYGYRTITRLPYPFDYDEQYSGVMDKNGNIMMSPEYSSIYNIGDSGYFIACESETGMYGIIDENYEWICEAEYSDIYKVWEDSTDNLVKVNGEYLLIAEYDFQEGHGAEIINEYGETIVPMEYYDINSQCGMNRLVVENSEGYYGAIDLEGNLEVPCQYDELGNFSYDNETYAMKDNAVFIVDIYGNERFLTNADECWQMDSNLYEVGINENWNVIDSNGEYLFSETHDNHEVNEKYIAGNNEEKKHGMLILKSGEVVNTEYQKYMLSYTVPDIVGVYDGANYGMLGSNGELIVPCSYDSCEISEDGAYITADRQKDEYGNYTECTLFDSNGNKIETFDTGIYNVGVFRKISNAA